SHRRMRERMHQPEDEPALRQLPYLVVVLIHVLELAKHTTNESARTTQRRNTVTVQPAHHLLRSEGQEDPFVVALSSQDWNCSNDIETVESSSSGLIEDQKWTNLRGQPLRIQRILVIDRVR